MITVKLKIFASSYFRGTCKSGIAKIRRRKIFPFTVFLHWEQTHTADIMNNGLCSASLIFVFMNQVLYSQCIKHQSHGSDCTGAKTNLRIGKVQNVSGSLMSLE